MRILTVGDSWTYGSESSDPATMSWPAQMSKKYNVEVVNLARGGASNQRASRVLIEEVCRDQQYDYIIFPLAPGSRTEVLKHGKWQQIWPGLGINNLDQIYTDFWHPWNDLQLVMLESFKLIYAMKGFNIPLYIGGLSFCPRKYKKELDWILHYKNDNNFNALNMPLNEFNIGITDLDRKLKALKAIHEKNLVLQPDYLTDITETYLLTAKTKKQYGNTLFAPGGHPNDAGYLALADYFAKKIGLN
jgi:hypothetical protein